VADYLPVFDGGADPFTLTAGGAIVGGRAVVLSAANTVVEGSAVSALCMGIAAFDCATGQPVTVWPLVNAIHELTTPAGVTQGQGVATSTAGGCDTIAIATGAAAGTLIGVAVTTAGAAGKVQFLGK
jgi:hypothetical protein